VFNASYTSEVKSNGTRCAERKVLDTGRSECSVIVVSVAQSEDKAIVSVSTGQNVAINGANSARETVVTCAAILDIQICSQRPSSPLENTLKYQLLAAQSTRSNQAARSRPATELRVCAEFFAGEFQFSF
jgi:hypothetical protein